MSSFSNSNRALIICGIFSGIILYKFLKLKTITKPYEEPPELLDQTEQSAEFETEDPIPQPKIFEPQDWSIEEQDNILKLLVSIAQEQTIQDTIVHSSVTCNN